MKYIYQIAVFVFFISCSSNTVYKKPKGLIPKDSMVGLLTDMHIASAAKSFKNKLLQKNVNYTFLVYQKYKIDSARFNESNIYYIAQVDEYKEILDKVQHNLDSLDKIYKAKKIAKDSLKKKSRKNISSELIEPLKDKRK